MTSLSDLAHRIVSLLRDHFAIENEPPPPCPDSITAWFLLTGELLDLKKSLPPDGNFTSSNSAEIYHHEITSRLREVAKELGERITVPKDHVGGLAALPPIPQRTFAGLCWAAERLRAFEPPIPPADESNRTPDTKPDSQKISCPKSPELLAFIHKLKRDIVPGVRMVDVARDFADGNEKKAENLLRGANRYKHLWKNEKTGH
jgi:hypothetical protein